MKKIYIFLLLVSSIQIYAQPTIVKNLGASANINNLTDVDGILFFTANDAQGNELWRSDGTESGTYRVKDIRTGPLSSDPTSFKAMNGTLFFSASDGVNGHELWKTDGTDAGTVMIKDINIGYHGSGPNYLTPINDVLYFVAGEALTGHELWKTDGTSTGTVLVKDFYPGFGGSMPDQMVNMNGTLYFAVTTAGAYRELWKTDGTVTGTMAITDDDTFLTVSFHNFTVVGNTLYFTPYDYVYGQELWKTDGTTAGTSIVKNIVPVDLSGDFTNLIGMNEVLYFECDDKVNGNGAELWRSDGTAAGTYLLKDAYPALYQHGYAKNMIVMGDTLYYVATDNLNPGLWQTDGTPGGTMKVFSIGTLSPEMIKWDSKFVFKGVVNGDAEPYISDGTVANTFLLGDLQIGSSSDPHKFTVCGNYVYFLANDGINDIQLWKTDGSSTLVTSVANELPSADNTNVFPIPSYDGIFTIDASNDIKLITVTNMLGITEQFYSNKIKTNLKGMLILEITDENGYTTKKRIVAQ
jgi:trimeric autotransporter adhesin